jgi:hypothetical protein
MMKFFNKSVNFFFMKMFSGRYDLPVPTVVTAMAFCIFLAGVLGFAVQPAAAQISEEAWDEPVNLSQSGGANNPHMVIDSKGKIHVIWEDRFDGFFYSFHHVDEWSSPVEVELPFESTSIQLLADQDGFIHAFWLDEDDSLLHSKVNADDIGDIEVEEAWEAPTTVGASAVKFAAQIDEDDHMHVVYIRPVQTTSSPAGIYYKNSLDGGVSWSSPKILYQSSYLRGVTAETSHVSISTAAVDEGKKIYVSWDNRSRKQVFLVKSEDRGETWSDPIEIDRPGSEFGASRPFNIRVSAQGENVLLIWQNGIPGMNCSQFYIYSSDAAESWSERLPLPASLPGCAQEIDLKPIKENLTLLLTGEQWQGFIQAWNATEWSDSKGQPLLSTFEDPEVLESISLQCRQFAYHPIYDRLFVVGCDTSGGGDIWISSRLIGDVDHWYPLPPVWNLPDTVLSSEANLSSLTLVSGSDDKFHLAWVEKASSSSVLTPAGDIYYSRVDSSGWTRPSTVPGLSGANPAGTSIAVDPAGRLLMAWSDNNSGNIYFQWANASQANSPSSWTSLVELPSSNSGARSPQLLIEQNGRLYVFYAVPLNEGRGIYLTWSTDRGEHWSSPVRIFDAETAGWEMVDRPRLAVDETGNLHAVFTRYSLPGGRGPLGLYYSRSTDKGETWSKGEQVVEKPVLWSRIVSAGDRGLHRAWMEIDAGRRQIMHQYSLDGGSTWTRSEIVSSYAGDSGHPELMVDSANRLHLLQVAQDIVGDLFLYHWQWDGVFWYANDSFSLQDFGDLAVTGFYSAVSGSGRISTVLSASEANGNGSLPISSIIITSRSIEMPETPLQPIPTPGVQAVLTPAPTQEPLPTHTPIIDLSVFESNNMLTIPSTPTNNGLFGLIIGGSLATFLVGLVLVIGMRKAKGKR